MVPNGATLVGGVILTRLNRISVPKGNVYHGLKQSDPGFHGFGEAYFTSIHHSAVKGWRRHKRMVLNLIVPVGRVRFVVHDDQAVARSPDWLQTFVLGDEAEIYNRLTVPPGYWLAFQGLGKNQNIILNVASIQHDPSESETQGLDLVDTDWTLTSPTGMSV